MVALLERPSAPPSVQPDTPLPMSELVIVANRLPIQRSRQIDGGWSASPGGLAATLSQALAEREEERGVTWVGWSGEAGPCDELGANGAAEGIHLVALELGDDEIECFYHGFSNGTLWPLYHDVVRPPVYIRKWWDCYMAVNRRYAEMVARHAAPGGSVWVHDYQLQLVPQMLRELRPDLRIGFFLHIPHPPQELFMQLPWRRQIIEGLLGADVVGFQVPVAAQNFAVLARRLTSARGSLPKLTYEGRVVHVGPYPVSIDMTRFEDLARRPDVIAQSRLLREQLGNPRVLLAGVDRLDYTKGIEPRLQAFRELLAERSISVPDVSMVQVAVPSRDHVAKYVEERERIEQLVGEINGDYGQMGAPAVHYLHRNLDLEDLVSLYIATDVMLVTPYRDGMNLVAKEYVASRVDDTGSLVLSEFAGAARELHAAVLVNPHDLDGLKEGILRAMRTPERDARRRMRVLRRAVSAWTASDWADRFLMDLDGTPQASAPSG